MQSHNYPNFCCAEKARTVQRLMKFTRTLFSETSDSKPKGKRDEDATN